jgi:hypothetical protein
MKKRKEWKVGVRNGNLCNRLTSFKILDFLSYLFFDEYKYSQIISIFLNFIDFYSNNKKLKHFFKASFLFLRFFLLILRANPQSDKEKYLKYYIRRAKIVTES